MSELSLEQLTPQEAIKKLDDSFNNHMHFGSRIELQVNEADAILQEYKSQQQKITELESKIRELESANQSLNDDIEELTYNQQIDGDMNK